jgi:peptidoglycan hydrolase CwlO-like protein
MDTDAYRTTTAIDVNSTVNQLEELDETMGIFASGSEALKKDVEGMKSGLVEHENKLRSLAKDVEGVKSSTEEENPLVQGIRQNLDILNQDLMALEEKIDEMQHVSYDGKFTWKITKFQEKMSK